MNIQYLSGFFDADGSITLAKENSQAKYKNLKSTLPILIKI